MSLLKKIIYYSKTYEFKGLKNFYAAWLREIELGKSSGSDEPHHIESAILTKHLRSQKGSNNKPVKESNYGEGKQIFNNKSASDESKVWFCQPFQRNKCEHKTNHMIVFKGKARMAMHICASCWLKDKVQLPHPECSTSCPHASE